MDGEKIFSSSSQLSHYFLLFKQVCMEEILLRNLESAQTFIKIMKMNNFLFLEQKICLSL